MAMVYGLSFGWFAFISYLLFRVSILYFNRVRTIREDKYLFIGGIVMGLLGIAMSVLAIWSFVQMSNALERKDIRYPAHEYRIETEITTRGGVSDTTYVITKN